MQLYGTEKCFATMVKNRDKAHILIRALAVWFLIMAVESVLGTLRMLFLAPAVGDLAARQIGVAVGMVLFPAISYCLLPWMRVTAEGLLIAVGLLWVTLTISFEIMLGRLTGLTWERIWSDYNLPKGGLMPLGLLVMAVSPLLAARLRRLGCLNTYAR